MMRYLFLIILVITNAYSNTDFEKIADESYRKIDNSLTIHIIPPTYRLDWSNSRNLILSILKNKYLFPKTTAIIGHVTAEINCQNNGIKRRMFLGQKVNNLEGFKDYLLNGYGFSILNRPKDNRSPLITIEGSLDNYEDSKREFERLIKKNNFAIISYRIDKESCNQTYQFMQEYKKNATKEDKVINRYGFGVSPKELNGGGCATFIETLMEMSKIKSVGEKLNRSIFVPDFLIGNKTKKVSIKDLIFNEKDLLLKEESDEVYVFPDPQVLYDELLKRANSQSDFIFKKKLNDSVYILVIDNIKRNKPL